MTSLFLASMCRPQLLKATDYYNYVALDLNLCSLGILVRHSSLGDLPTGWYEFL